MNHSGEDFNKAGRGEEGVAERTQETEGKHERQIQHKSWMIRQSADSTEQDGNQYREYKAYVALLLVLEHKAEKKRHAEQQRYEAE